MRKPTKQTPLESSKEVLYLSRPQNFSKGTISKLLSALLGDFLKLKNDLVVLQDPLALGFYPVKIS